MHSVPRKAEEATPSFTPSFKTVPANNLDATANIIFGVFAIIFAAATLWQGHKLWRNLRQHPPPNPTEATGTLSNISQAKGNFADGRLVEEQELDSIRTAPSIVVAADEQYALLNILLSSRCSHLEHRTAPADESAGEGERESIVDAGRM
ncbi:MAG: hypothetical protein LQ344_004875 [Seirophora lacunosa]|nr:MAG: hypothetical protein LQ344_004875 [Seirophora lacunosa]